MTTLTKLQAHLTTEVRNVNGYPYKNLAKIIITKDGTSLSVQASQNHYSTPRRNEGPYSHVEVWCVTGAAPNGVTEFDYDDNDPSAYVPIEDVTKFIDAHGGMV